MDHTITIKEANSRVAKYINQTRSALPPEVRFEKRYEETQGTCTPSTNSEIEGMVLATKEYEILGIPREKIPENFSQLRNWWVSHGWRVLHDKPANEYLWVEHKVDGFRMSLQANDNGEIFIIATSPCVWPNGTPTSES